MSGAGATPPSSAQSWLPTHSDCGRLIAKRDWSGTPLGPIAEWPQSLRTALGIVLHSPVPIVMLWGEDGTMLYNDAYSVFAGGRHPQLLGSKVREGWPEVADFNDHVMKVGLAGGTLSYKDQELTLYRTGEPELVSMNLDYSPVPGEDGRPAGVLAIVIETTERLRAEREQKQAEAALRESEERFRNMADHAPVMMWVTEPDGTCSYLNRAWYEFTGQQPGEGEGFGWLEMVHPEDRDPAGATFLAANAKREAFRIEHRLRRVDGEYRWAIDAASPRFGAGGEFLGYIGSVIDIDDRRDAEDALRAAAEQLAKEAGERSAILGQLVEGVIVTDPEGRITFVNDAAKQLHGVEALDVAPSEYSDTYHLFREDGSPHPFEELPLARAVMKGETVVDARWRIRRPDGTSVLAIGSARPITDAGEIQVGSVLTVRDDTSRFAAEEALAEALKTSDVLLHEVNHRVKNSLQIVTGLLMLQAGQAADPVLRQALLEARGRISVVAAMHQRLYSTSDHDRVDFGEYVRELTAETLASLGGEERIALDTRIEPGIMILLQQAVPLALVVSELVTNAIKYAFPDERTGKIGLFLQRTADLIVLEIRDDGAGLPADFDPAERKGLGMRIVTSLVKQVRGKLEIDNADPGAVFRIVIPAERID